MKKIVPGARILLTGASGFVGSSLHPALTRVGYAVRGMTRIPERALSRWPDREWVAGDLEDEASVRAALDGCDAAYYLAHSMGGGADFRQREHEQAERFSRIAAECGVQRIVYLGGIDPQGPPSEHLASRLEVGRILREGAVPTLELRAGMIVGTGSLSWTIVRDLAARLPFMVLPKWLKSRMEPVAIDDVIHALRDGLALELLESAAYDLPGPEAMTGREALERTAISMGLRRPLMVPVPFLTPRLSSHWLRFVTRAEWSVARELVLGLSHDLLARSREYWLLIGHPGLVPFEEAARRALAQETAAPISGLGARLESLVRGIRAAPA